MKNKKSLIIVIIVLLVVVGVATLLALTAKDKENDGVNKTTEYSHITALLDSYNAKNEGTATDVTLMESETELAFMINDYVETETGEKQKIFVNYTTMQISSVVYDKDLKPTQIINMYINDTYTVKKVVVYDYSTEKLITYESNDKEIEEYQKRANIMSDKIKEIFNETSLNGVTLFNKTITDVKDTTVNK